MNDNPNDALSDISLEEFLKDGGAQYLDLRDMPIGSFSSGSTVQANPYWDDEGSLQSKIHKLKLKLAYD